MGSQDPLPQCQSYLVLHNVPSVDLVEHTLADEELVLDVDPPLALLNQLDVRLVNRVLHLKQPQ